MFIDKHGFVETESAAGDLLHLKIPCLSSQKAEATTSVVLLAASVGRRPPVSFNIFYITCHHLGWSGDKCALNVSFSPENSCRVKTVALISPQRLKFNL